MPEGPVLRGGPGPLEWRIRVFQEGQGFKNRVPGPSQEDQGLVSSNDFRLQVVRKGQLDDLEICGQEWWKLTHWVLGTLGYARHGCDPWTEMDG